MIGCNYRCLAYLNKGIGLLFKYWYTIMLIVKFLFNVVFMGLHNNIYNYSRIFVRVRKSETLLKNFIPIRIHNKFGLGPKSLYTN